MNKKLMSYLASGILILGVAAGAGAYKAHTAQAAAQDTRAAVSVTQENKQQDEQQPTYESSVRMADSQDVKEIKDKGNEAAESNALKQLAKITAEQARASAMKAVPGQVNKVSLDNENGNVVYSVEIKTVKGTTDVKIDAGNGKVLARDFEQDNNQDKNLANDREESNDGPDNDNTEHED
ncbi:PepSY domain-containing protein [Desulfotruncus alcoholivorax]|uniref:PepSY domain-containing protein n=1 Tax=Desulfotruncus alcoholivorax TaxID=265477 RepID=UPI0003F8CADF|nr:PepSY domain-containing protein [Desulfotruncus alcoholivorax]